MLRAFSICGTLALLGVGLMLTGCDPASTKGLDVSGAVNKVDTALSSNSAQTAFAVSCGIVTVLDNGYKSFADQHPDKISKTAKKYIGLAEAALVDPITGNAICKPPYPTSVATLAPKVASALTNMYLAYSAQGLNPAVTISAATADGSTTAAHPADSAVAGAASPPPQE